VRRVHAAPLAAVVALVALLALVTAEVGLGVQGWAVGLGCGTGLAILLSRALDRHRARLGPAGAVTLTRATLACAVAALVAESFGGSTPVRVLVALSVVALLLDLVDGRVARRTHTVTALGARFDMESDAFLIAVLSVYVAPSAGWWVLAIGAARYALLLAQQVVPWLRRPVPPRYWCKVVAAVQGVVLVVAAAGVLPQGWTDLALIVAFGLLAESFGRDVWWLWRHRTGRVPAVVRRGRDARAIGQTSMTVTAAVAVWLALVLPNDVTDLDAGAFLRIPVEGLLVVALALVLGPRARVAVASIFGLALGLLLIVKVFDMGFHAVLDRPFDPISDWTYLGPGVGVLGDSIGRPGAIASAVAAAVLVVLVLVLVPAAAVRLAHASARGRRTSLHVVTSLGVVWVLCAATGLQFAPAGRIASTTAAGQAYDEVRQVRADLADRRTFAREITVDHFADTPAHRLLTGLRGKDVIVAFVESYGRIAVQDSTFAPGVDAVLDDGTRRLRAAGYATRSAFLTSPTYGAASWLAHSTLQSGLWVDSQQRYDQLLGEDRLTLTSAFEQAGWSTVFDVPANTEDWPDGERFYGMDRLYDSRNVGYQGPAFSYAPMPDQYTLDAFRRLELAPSDRPPVMAEIDLISSHHPWTPLPHLVDWHSVGDGSVFDGMPEQGESPDEVFRDPDAVRRVYGESIEYTMESLVSFLETYPDPNLVLVVLGDHQPHSYVSGEGAGHDVPISVIAHDPKVLDRISGWGWQHGLHPRPDAPVWRMDAFRDRFLTAFGPR
jgi:phosphatidylglycerophosphate synthase